LVFVANRKRTGVGDATGDGGGFEILDRVPTTAEYRALCEAVGWGELINFGAAAAALPRSLHAVVAQADDRAVGMGRIVGDGAIFFYVQDVAVRPGYRGRGIGAAILDALVSWVRRNAAERSFLGLFAVTGTEAFYERFGFGAHAHDIGMYQVIRPNGTSRASAP
jgi:GNAT superfamily N-acetyltransferase